MMRREPPEPERVDFGDPLISLARWRERLDELPKPPDDPKALATAAGRTQGFLAAICRSADFDQLAPAMQDRFRSERDDLLAALGGGAELRMTEGTRFAVRLALSDSRPAVPAALRPTPLFGIPIVVDPELETGRSEVRRDGQTVAVIENLFAESRVQPPPPAAAWAAMFGVVPGDLARLAAAVRRLTRRLRR